jgi:ABC-2 type transport system permease protein
VVFPAGFNKDLVHSNKAQVQIIADASDPNTGSTLANYATAIIRDYEQGTREKMEPPMRVNTETRMVYNPELKGTTNFVPGVMALVLVLICVLMTSASIVREKEGGTMEVLLVSPFNPLLVIISKAVPYFFFRLLI